MNLKSRKVRLPIAVLGACALVTGGGMLTAGSAFAVGQTLSFQGATGNAASTVTANLNIGLESVGYGVRVAGISGSSPIQVESLSAPTGGFLETKRVSGGAAPGATGTFTPITNGPSGSSTAVTVSTTAGSKNVTFSLPPQTLVPANISLAGLIARIGTGAGTQYALISTHTSGSTSAVLAVPATTTTSGLALATTFGTDAYTTVPAASVGLIGSYTTGDNLYVGGSVAGTYTFRVFSDVNSDAVYQANTDDTTPTFTLTVKDPVDAFALTAPSSVTAGTAGTMAKVTPSIDVTDIRGGTPSTLGAAIAAVSSITVTDNGPAGVTGEGSGSTVNYTTADGFYRYLGSSSSQALGLGSDPVHTLGTALAFAGVAVPGATKTTEVVSNSVSTLPLAVKSGQTANVSVSGAAATVRVGTADVTYTATAKDSGGAVLSGKDVTFTLTGTSGTTASTDLKANGATVPSNGQVVITTDSDGVATLKVTSTKTANGNAYSVAAVSGTASGTTITSTHATTAVTTVTSSSVAAVVGGSAVVSGKVVDQFGEPYSASGLTAALAVTGSATPASGNFTIGSDGKFSATVNDTASNTTPRNDTFTWTVSSVSSGSKTLAWRTSITPGAVGIATTTIAGSSTDTAIPFTSTTTRVDLASSGAFSGDVETVKGTVTDTASTPAALPFASVTYTGSDGVWFYDADNKLVKTTTAVTTSTGKLSYDGSTDGLRVLFTKTGDATVTAKSGAITKTVTVPVEASTDPYKVIAIDVNGKPGTTITVQGKVNDVFGNPATNAQVTLALSSVSAGNFSATDGDADAGFQVTTDAEGVWSTPFTSTSNQSGTVTLTATLRTAVGGNDLTSNPTVNAAYSTAGLTIGAGEYTDQSTVKIGAIALELTSSPHMTYGSPYYARGAKLTGSGAYAGSTVEIFSKLPGGSYDLIDTVTAGDDGTFVAYEKISKSTYFLVKSEGATSSSSSTRIYSGVKLVATSTKADRVTLSANGGPNAKAYLYFYRVFANGDADYLGKTMSSVYGNGARSFKAPSGDRKYKVTFRAPGTSTGSGTDTVTVK